MAKKILIIDDSRTVRQQLNFTLSKAGYEIVEVEDGVEGISRLKEHPDVAMMICDLNMPNMDGLTMVETIKADSKLPKPPFVMLTTEGASEQINRAKGAGAKGYMVKPFKPEQLVAVVTKIAGG